MISNPSLGPLIEEAEKKRHLKSSCISLQKHQRTSAHSLDKMRKFCCGILLLSAFSLSESFAFSNGGLSSSIQATKQVPITRLFEKSDDNEKDESSREQFNNDLDIFGQPKNKPRQIVDEGDIRGADRIKSCIPYMLVMIDGDMFGKYIYERIPPLGTLDYIFLRPIVEGVQAAPFLSIILFAIFALGPRLTDQSREVRFNSQQAVFLDIAILLPSLIAESVADAHLPRAILEPAANFVWYTYISAVLYCVTSNLRGKVPNQIPWISAMANDAIGPF